MPNTNEITIRLPSGCNVDMSTDLHDNYFRNFTESQFFSFSNFINAGLYFPQIMQFVTVITVILNGWTNWSDIILCNLASGIFYTLFWFIARCYKIPGLSFISCLIGGNIFRFFLHFIAIAIISIFVIEDWTVLLFCLIGGLVTALVKAILFARLSNVKYHNQIVKYVSAFKHKV